MESCELTLYRWSYCHDRSEVRICNVSAKVCPTCCFFSLCVLHLHALSSKILLEYLKLVIEETIQSVNFARFGILNYRLFRILPEKMDSDHTVLIFYTKVRWLSKGQIFARVI